MIKKINKYRDLKINIEAFVLINIVLLVLTFGIYKSPIIQFAIDLSVLALIIILVYRYIKKQYYWLAYLFAVIGLVIFIYNFKT
jgi:hypothetical protein